MKGEMTKMQTSFNIQDGTGSELLEQLNNAFKSLATNNSGGTEPEETYGGMFWLDTSQTNKILKQRTADNTAWITFGEIDENGLFHSANTLASDDESVTKKGNIFNAANKLVLLNEQGALPELDGSLLTLPTKATTSLDNLTDEGKAKFDGEWIDAGHTTIFSNRALSTSNASIEFLLDFLPDDNIYEVIFNIGITLTYPNNYCYGSVGLSTDIISSPFAAHRNSGSAASGHNYTTATIIIPVKNKKIYLSGDSQNRYSTAHLVAVAYHKLGIGFEAISQNEET